MSTERIVAALEAIATRVEHKSHCAGAGYGTSGSGMAYRLACTCDREDRVLAAQGDAIASAVDDESVYHNVDFAFGFAYALERASLGTA